jgi:hypothetical protein
MVFLLVAARMLYLPVAAFGAPKQTWTKYTGF